MQISYSPRFAKKLRKINAMVQAMLIDKEKIFLTDLFDPRLKTHKLKGRLESFYAFSINSKYRVIFELVGKDHAYFHNVGSHDIYE